MTPAICLLVKKNIPHKVHEYVHHADAESFGLEAAEALRVEPSRMFKTLVALVDDRTLVMGVVPVAGRMNLKALAAAAGGKKADLADRQQAEKATGYLVGGISPLAGRKALLVVVDQSAASFPTIYISAGRRGLQIELSPSDLLLLSRAAIAAIAQEP